MSEKKIGERLFVSNLFKKNSIYWGKNDGEVDNGTSTIFFAS